MKSKSLRIVGLCIMLAGLIPLSHAGPGVVVSDTTPATLNGDDFSDGASDYWGVVDPGGATINGTPYSNGVFGVTSAAGDLTGRDLDQAGGSGATTRVGVWTLTLPPGETEFVNIDFTGLAAATQAGIAGGPLPPVWTGLGSLVFTLETNLGTVATETYTPNAPNGDLAFNGVGAILTTLGTALNLTDAGGVGVTSVTLRVSATSDSSQEIFWVDGTLMADAVPVELQSFSIE